MSSCSSKIVSSRNTTCCAGTSSLEKLGDDAKNLADSKRLTQNSKWANIKKVCRNERHELVLNKKISADLI